MTGGLMQLVAYGAQDIYLTGDPSITYFKNLHRRHTNFAMESIQQTLNGTANFGGRVSCTIARSGDLVKGLTLEATLPQNIDGGIYIDDVGHHLIQEVEVEVGGQRIDKHYGDWLEIWAQLTVPAGKEEGYRAMIGQSQTVEGTTGGHLLQDNNGMAEDAEEADRKIYVPLQFWFCRNVGLALPLIALQYHEVKVNIQFNTLANLCTDEDGTVEDGTLQTTPLEASLWADYVYLDTDERRRFAQVSHEYLIEQLQFAGDSTYAANTSTTAASVHDPINLNFNHPVKELIWVAREASHINDGLNQYSNYTDMAAHGANGTLHKNPSVPGTSQAHNIVRTAKLRLNGQDRFATRDGTYFNRVQPYQHHTRIPQSPGINVYSFALKPEDHQPSGTCNFSRIDNARLELTLGGQGRQLGGGVVKVYGTNYNVFRVMSGMGGTAYSN